MSLGCRDARRPGNFGSMGNVACSGFVDATAGSLALGLGDLGGREAHSSLPLISAVGNALPSLRYSAAMPAATSA